jgi:hypothetical protein
MVKFNGTNDRLVRCQFQGVLTAVDKYGVVYGAASVNCAEVDSDYES